MFAGMLLEEVNYIQLSSLTEAIHTTPAVNNTRWVGDWRGRVGGREGEGEG